MWHITPEVTDEMIKNLTQRNSGQIPTAVSRKSGSFSSCPNTSFTTHYLNLSINNINISYNHFFNNYVYKLSTLLLQ